MDELKDLINENITDNGDHEITGAKLRSTLLAMVDALGGVTPDGLDLTAVLCCNITGSGAAMEPSVYFQRNIEEMTYEVTSWEEGGCGCSPVTHHELNITITVKQNVTKLLYNQGNYVTASNIAPNSAPVDGLYTYTFLAFAN